MSVQGKFLSRRISEIFWKEELSLSTAESCTSGNIASLITTIPGSSKFYKGGLVAYSNDAKIKMLHVKEETLEKFGAVSEETVKEMVAGAIEAFGSDYAIATSGIAGPTGGSHDKPVGTVWIAAGTKNNIVTLMLEEDNGREQNVQNATVRAMQLLCDLFENEENQQ